MTKSNGEAREESTSWVVLVWDWTWTMSRSEGNWEGEMARAFTWRNEGNEGQRRLKQFCMFLSLICVDSSELNWNKEIACLSLDNIKSLGTDMRCLLKHPSVDIALLHFCSFIPAMDQGWARNSYDYFSIKLWTSTGSGFLLISWCFRSEL